MHSNFNQALVCLLLLWHGHSVLTHISITSQVIWSIYDIIYLLTVPAKTEALIPATAATAHHASVSSAPCEAHQKNSSLPPSCSLIVPSCKVLLTDGAARSGLSWQMSELFIQHAHAYHIYMDINHPHKSWQIILTNSNYFNMPTAIIIHSIHYQHNMFTAWFILATVLVLV